MAATKRIRIGAILERGERPVNALLRRCRSAMGADATLLLADQILEPDPARGHAIDDLVDMQTMAMFGQAKEPTESEFVDDEQRAGQVLAPARPRRRQAGFALELGQQRRTTDSKRNRRLGRFSDSAGHQRMS